MELPVVVVRGEAQLEVPPDLATLTLRVERRDSAAEPVQRGLATASGQLRELLERFSAAVERASTSGLHTNPVYGSRETGTEVRAWAGELTAEIVLHDFAVLSDVLQALDQIPHTQVVDLTWSLRPDSPVHRQARLAAVADARQRAEDYAAAFGARLEGLLEVADVDGGFGGGGMPRRYAMKGAPEEGPPAYDLEPARQRVTAQLNARFVMSAPDLTASPPG